jgi:hypothetical protein
MILDEITRKQLIWYGHGERMDPTRLPKIKIHWKPVTFTPRITTGWTSAVVPTLRQQQYPLSLLGMKPIAPCKLEICRGNKPRVANITSILTHPPADHECAWQRACSWRSFVTSTPLYWPILAHRTADRERWAVRVVFWTDKIRTHTKF